MTCSTIQQAEVCECLLKSLPLSSLLPRKGEKILERESLSLMHAHTFLAQGRGRGMFNKADEPMPIGNNKNLLRGGA
jgi:hypothetical protein